MGSHGGDTAWGKFDDVVHDVHGLRIIAINSNVEGRLHGSVDDVQLTWLRSALEVPAPHGTVLVLHHPPVPTPQSPNRNG